MEILKRIWDAITQGTAERWIAIGSTIFIPLTIAVLGACVSSAIQESDKRVKYIELAIGILGTDPSPNTENLRDWAIRVMADYSEVPINEKMKQELRTNKISFSDTLSLGESLGTKVIRGK